MTVAQNLLFLVCVIFASAVGFYWIDYPLAEWVDKEMPKSWKTIFEYVTYLGDGLYAAGLTIMFYVVGVALGAWTKNNRSHPYHKKSVLYRMRARILFSCLIVGGLVVHALKVVFGRSRPGYYVDYEPNKFEPLTLTYPFDSLPSGHTQTAFTLAFCLSAFYPRFGVLFWALAALGGLSRVILLKHYPGDVFFGAYVGITCSVLVYAALKKKLSP